MIVGAVEASEFVLSMPARFTYELNQMWSSHARAEEAARAAQPDAIADAGVSWCYSLRAVCLRLKRYQRWRWRGRARPVDSTRPPTSHWPDSGPTWLQSERKYLGEPFPTMGGIPT